MLTAIVVGVATLALGLSLVVRIKEEYGTIEEDEITRSRTMRCEREPPGAPRGRPPRSWRPRWRRWWGGGRLAWGSWRRPRCWWALYASIASCCARCGRTDPSATRSAAGLRPTASSTASTSPAPSSPSSWRRSAPSRFRTRARAWRREVAEDRGPLFYAAFILCLTGLLGITITGDVFNVFVFLEISSLSAYSMIALGTDRRALTAALPVPDHGERGSDVHRHRHRADVRDDRHAEHGGPGRPTPGGRGQSDDSGGLHLPDRRASRSSSPSSRCTCGSPTPTRTRPRR